MRDENYYQKAIELNRDQALAFKALQRAVKRCNETNVYFYQSLERLGALNGDNVADVYTYDVLTLNSLSPNCLQRKVFPCTNTTCSFADDNHFIKLQDE